MFFVGTGHFIEEKNSKEGWVPTWTHTKEKCYWSKGQKKKKNLNDELSLRIEKYNAKIEAYQ